MMIRAIVNRLHTVSPVLKLASVSLCQTEPHCPLSTEDVVQADFCQLIAPLSSTGN